MKHLTIIPLVALLASTMCMVTSCSSDEEFPTEDSEILINSADNLSAYELFGSTDGTAMSEDSIRDYFDTVTMLDSAEFFSRLKKARIKELPVIDRMLDDDTWDSCDLVTILDSAEFISTLERDRIKELPVIRSRTPGKFEIKQYDKYYRVTLGFRGFRVWFDTNYPYQFPRLIGAFKASYELADGEFPGRKYGHVKSDSEMFICMDIVRATGVEEYDYAYTVGIEAIIRDRTYLINPLRDL